MHYIICSRSCLFVGDFHWFFQSSLTLNLFFSGLSFLGRWPDYLKNQFCNWHEIFSSFSLYKVPCNEQSKISNRLLNLKLFKKKNTEKPIILRACIWLNTVQKIWMEWKIFFVDCIILFLTNLVWKKQVSTFFPTWYILARRKQLLWFVA